MPNMKTQALRYMIDQASQLAACTDHDLKDPVVIEDRIGSMLSSIKETIEQCDLNVNYIMDSAMHENERFARRK